MKQLKCENCGANLSLSKMVNGVIKCEYCNSEYIQGEIEENKDKLYYDDVHKEITNDTYVYLNIYGEKRKFYISSTQCHKIWLGENGRRLDGSLVTPGYKEKLQIELIEI